jgi:N-acetyl-beta-hexosaminidase
VNCTKTMWNRRSDGASVTDIPALDISNPLTIQLIREILTQLADVFDSDYIHVGGDEVRQECWDESPQMVR